MHVIIQPLDEGQQAQVCAVTVEHIEQAGRMFNFATDAVPVAFDLTGTAAGMYRVRGGERMIRYNPFIFAKYFADSLAVTVPHEVAHYVTDRLYGLGTVRPHGAEWRQVMRALGADPRVTAHYDLSGLPVRRQRRFSYRCECGTHQLTTRRHNKIQRGQADYLCRRCGSAIFYADVADLSARARSE